jgi:CHAD domain-containing protein
LRAELLPVIDVRALVSLARVAVAVSTFRVLDDECKTVARIHLETPALLSANGVRTPLSTRIRLGGVRGYDAELSATRRAVRAALAAGKAPMPLVDEAVLAAGGAPAGTSAKVEVKLSGKQRADTATVKVLRRLLEIMDANLPGTVADLDSEFLHDYRVAIRRTRSVQREFAEVFPPEELARMRAEFRWLQLATGDSRDLDVYVLGFAEMRALVPAQVQRDLEPLLVVLRGRRLTARREMLQALRSERTAELRRDWEALLDALPELPAADRPSATRPIAEVASERIRKVYRRMVRMGEAIREGGAEIPAEDYHELRTKGKELRYLLELFAAPLFATEVVKPMIRALKGLQDVLGRHQDREVQVELLRSLGDEVSALPGGSAALIAMGALVERLAEDAAAARGEFADSFAQFASARQRRLVKETFR